MRRRKRHLQHSQALFITPGPDGSITSTGPIQLLGGTGAFTNLTGHGVDNATGNFATGVEGQISGFVVHGQG